MNCPECDQPNVKTKCRGCGWSALPATKGAEKSAHPNPKAHRRCQYQTGTWQCQWGKYAPIARGTVYCDFHAAVVSFGLTATSDQWQMFCEEREWIQEYYPVTCFLSTKDIGRYGLDGMAGIKHMPFWYQPVQEAWRTLTGLPVPVQREEVACGGT